MARKGRRADDQQTILVDGGRLTEFAPQIAPGLNRGSIRRIQFANGLVKMRRVNEAGLVKDRAGDVTGVAADDLRPDLGVSHGVDSVHGAANERDWMHARSHVENAILSEIGR